MEAGTQAGRGFPPGWWAYGLNLAERLPGDGHGERAPDAQAGHRVRQWEDAHPGGGSGLDARLAATGNDRAQLAMLVAEPAGRLAARRAEPAWAGFVADALGGASGGAPAGRGGPAGPGDPAGPLAAFAAPIVPLVGEVRRRVAVGSSARGLPPTEVDVVCAGVESSLLDRLTRAAARTFVLELHRARASGRLAGATGAERFADFVAQLSDGGLVDLLTGYPVLARLLGQASLDAVETTVEMVCRFVADRRAIVDELLGGVDPGPLVAVHTGCGDRHGGGRSVAVLRFGSGRAVVYKPRTLTLHHCFGRLVGWLNDRQPDLKLRVPACLDRQGHGWVEFVEHRPCDTVDEVDRFYARLGALVALLYALDATDAHYENLVACGDQPVLVDVETLFQPVLTSPRAVPDPAAGVLESSVLRTCLLPQLLFGEHGALDISAFGAAGGQPSPVGTVAWEAAGTDQMRLVRRPVPFAGAVNRPRLGAAEVDPAGHAAQLLAGFRTGYDTLVRHRRELATLLGGCAGLQTRVLARHTRAYATILDESSHPDVLRNGLDRERVFDTLWTESVDDPVRQRLFRHEVRDLWAGDVPMFLGRTDARHVESAAGVREPDVVAVSGLEAVTAKLGRMGHVDRRRQEWLISAALATTGIVDHRASDPMGGHPSGAPTPDRLLAAACCVADEIVACAARDSERVNWIGMEPVGGRHWAVLPAGAGLADGYTGVALFLGQLGRLTGATRYTELARAAVAPLPQLIEHLRARPALAAAATGGFRGLGGICYALSRLAGLLDDDELHTWSAAAVELLAELPDGAELDLDTGVAGGLAAMLAVRRDSELPAAGQLAERYARHLVEAFGQQDAGDRSATGFLHGTTGIGWSLLRFAATAGGAECGTLGRQLVLADRPATDHGWCSGTAGTVLARVCTAEEIGRPEWPDLQRRMPLRDISLCHGELGAAEALAVLAGRGRDRQSAAAALRRSMTSVLASIEQHTHRCGTPSAVPVPGLLSGLAGIGYGLLRIGFPELVPSVLLLEPGSVRSEGKCR